MAKVIKKAKKKTHVDANGFAHIKATFNNVIVTITDIYGNTISWSSAGKNDVIKSCLYMSNTVCINVCFLLSFFYNFSQNLIPPGYQTLFLGWCFFLSGNCLSFTFTCTGISTSSLSSSGQTLSVSNSSVSTNVH